MGVGLLFRQLKHIHTGLGEHCSIYPLSVFLPESLPGLSIDVLLPPTQRAQAMPTMEHLLPPAGILRPGHLFLTAWHLARERGLCVPETKSEKQRPTSWGLPLTCTDDVSLTDDERQSRQASVPKCQANTKLCHLPQHCQKQRLLRRWVHSLTPIVTATSEE